MMKYENEESGWKGKEFTFSSFDPLDLLVIKKGYYLKKNEKKEERRCIVERRYFNLRALQ